MQQIQVDDITLIKSLGKGSFGEVYLSTRRGRKEYFATKKIDRKTVDKPSLKKYFDNEINILSELNHPNIVKLECVKTTERHYYIVMEYINGGGLSDCLKKYMEKNTKAFSEEIVQYLMRQTIDALNYLHKQKIIHRDLKLDNIMVNFERQLDKENLNMMKATIKIIDFGFATKLSAKNNDLTFSAVGSPINMDPIILKKFSNKKDINTIGYDEKADIWSIGTVCYELLIGKAVFDAKTMNDLVDKVQNGNYTVPKTVSKEVVSFLNGMLQFDAKQRLSAEELSKHDFLTKNISEFTKMNTVRASKKPNTDIKKNKSIWAIFNDEEKYENIQGGKNKPLAPISEEERNVSRFPINKQLGRNKSNPKQHDNIHNKIIDNNPNNIQKLESKNSNNNLNRYNDINEKLHRVQTAKVNQGYNNYTSFYGQSMQPNASVPTIGMPQMAMVMPGMNYQQQQPIVQYPSFGVGVPYSYNGAYQNRPMSYNEQNSYRHISGKQLNYNNMYKGTKYEDNCSIQ